MTEFVDRALTLAKRSPIQPYGTGCVIVRNKAIVSEGVSHMSNIRLTELHSLHSEIHALASARHLELKNTNSSVYIATWKHDTERIVMSKPCLTCAVALRGAGILSAWYTDGVGGIAHLDLEDDLSGLKKYRKP